MSTFASNTIKCGRTFFDAPVLPRDLDFFEVSRPIEECIPLDARSLHPKGATRWSASSRLEKHSLSQRLPYGPQMPALTEETSGDSISKYRTSKRGNGAIARRPSPV